jgi:long-chain acyl-CoA synthetase
VVVTEATVDSEEIARLCRERLSDYKVPETFTLTNAPLPKNANGKVDKKVLRDRIMADLDSETG